MGDGGGGATVSATDDELRRFFRIAGPMFCIVGPDGRFLEVSDAWTRVLGWRVDELVGRSFLDLLHPDDHAASLRLQAQMVAGEQALGFDNRYRHRDGGYRWLRWDAVVDHDTDRFYGVVQDVTEQRRREAFERQLEQVSGVGTWEVDLDRNRTRWSPQTYAIHEVDEATLAEAEVDVALRFYPPESRPIVTGALERLLADGTPFDLELPFETWRGRRRWVRTTGRSELRDGVVVRAYGTFQDVTADHEEREELRHFRDLVELSDEGLVELDAEQRLVYVNPRLAERLGTHPDRLLGRPVDVLVPPGALELEAGWTARLEDTPDGGVLRAEVPLVVPGRPPVWMQVAARVHRHDDGTIDRVTAVLTDISHLKVAQQELEETQRWLETAQRIARIGHWYVDEQERVFTWSPMVYEVLGVDPASFDPSPETFLELVHPDDREQLLETFEVGRQQGSHELTYRVVPPGGELRVVQELAQVTYGANGKVVGVTGTVQDITEIARTERALRRNEDRLERALMATRDGWWDNDLVAGEVFHSPRWWQIHGYRPGELTEHPDLWRRFTPEDELLRIDGVLARTIAQRAPTFAVRAKARHRDGHLVPVSIEGYIEYAADGSPVRISGVTSDLTEAVRVEELKDRFLATVSHELRTPLTSIGGALELLRAGVPEPVPDAADRLLDVAARNTVRLRRLIDDLLDVEQLAQGGLRLDLSTVALQPLVQEAVTTDEALAARHGVRFALRSELDREVRVRVDPSRLQQVLANYLSNATKFAPEGSEVEVLLERREKTVRTTVLDRGAGVPPGFRHRAFERFAQADPEDPRSRGGTGLGLAISRELIERFGGEVGYDSEPGCTRFWFDLPVVADAG